MHVARGAGQVGISGFHCSLDIPNCSAQFLSPILLSTSSVQFSKAILPPNLFDALPAATAAPAAASCCLRRCRQQSQTEEPNSSFEWKSLIVKG